MNQPQQQRRYVTTMTNTSQPNNISRAILQQLLPCRRIVLCSSADEPFQFQSQSQPATCKQKRRRACTGTRSRSKSPCFLTTRLVSLLLLLATSLSLVVVVQAVSEESESQLRAFTTRSPTTAANRKRHDKYKNKRKSKKSRIPSPALSPSSSKDDPTEKFLEWCRDSLGIETKLEIQTFQYYDYIRAMHDRVDVFCEDCYNQNDHDDDNNNYDDAFWEIDDDAALSVTDYPMIPVRGLAAAQDISIGEVVIRIPHASLWTVENCIDNDPVLSQVMGLKARQRHGWNSQMDEIPLLTVALLYHIGKDRDRDQEDSNQKDQNPFHQSHYTALLEATNMDHIPHLWDSSTLRTSTTVGVRKVAKGIQKDVQDLYETIVLVLMEENPDLFGDEQQQQQHTPNGSTSSGSGDGPTSSTSAVEVDGSLSSDEEEEEDYSSDDDEEDDDDDDYDDEEEHEESVKADDLEWLFSLERFHWAFALVNSRHWHLPLPAQHPQPQVTQEQEQELLLQLERQDTKQEQGKEKQQQEPEKLISAPTNDSGEGGISELNHFSELAAPPAAMPTDEWLNMQRQEARKEEESSFSDQHQITDEQQEEWIDGQEHEQGNDFWPSGNSFLAPVADLLNFGPPCTRGIYNDETRTFDIVATCNFKKGQEVTFWYADACQDVFVANYGFTHPMMVPSCESGTGDRTNKRSKQLQEQLQIQLLQQELMIALDELNRMDQELEGLTEDLEDCDCPKAHRNDEPKASETYLAPPIVKRRNSIPATPSPPRDIRLQSTDGKTTTSSSSSSPKNPTPTTTAASSSATTAHHARHAIRGADRHNNMMSPKDGLTRGGTARKQNRAAYSRKSDL